MFESIIRFFTRLFGLETDSDGIGFEDASDLPANIIARKIPPPEEESDSRSAGSRSVNTSDFEELDGSTESSGIDTVTVSNPKYLWCLDNGHGRLQAGKRSPVWSDGVQLQEWRFNREIVQRMAKKMDKIGLQYFIVVPEDDVDSFLSERVARANNKQSILGLDKLFISIHANAASAGATGVECWYHLNSSTGIRLASVFQRHLMRALGQESYPWRDRGIRTYSPANRNFYVLRKTSMPAVLTENGFYTNEHECRELLKPKVMDIIAEAHVAAILEIEMNGFQEAKIYDANLQLSIS